MTVHITNLHGMNYDNVAQIAQNMVAKIGCQNLHFNELGIYMYDSSHEPTNELNARFDGMIASLSYGDTVIFQAPSWNSIEWDQKFIDHIRLYPNMKIIIFIEDVIPLMFESNRYLLPKFIDLYNKADLLIVPSVKMMHFLRENGLENKEYVVQYMWDHLANVDETIQPQNSHLINFTGNPDKFEFVKNWDYDVRLQLYGKEESENNNPKVKYMGWQNDSILLNNLRKEGGLGLVWSEEPYWSEYMTMNATYKLSTYLAAGIPIIVNSQTPSKDVIVRKHLGIIADSLDEAVEKVKNFSDEDYQQMTQSISYFSRLIREGYFTKRALIEAVFKVRFD